MAKYWLSLWTNFTGHPRACSRAQPCVEVLEDRSVPSGGIQEFLVPTPGAGPVGIASGPDGALWFTENATNKIGRVTTGGVVTNESVIPTSGADPDGIVAGPDGALWFTEFFGNKIGRITTAGTITNEFAISTPNSNPKGITVGADGNLWFTEEQGNKVGRITTAGVIKEFNLPAGSHPIGIVGGPDRNLWVTESGLGKIAVLDTNGVLLHEFALPTPSGSPQGITAGPDSALWFAEEGSNKIGRITTAGTITEFALSEPGSAPEGITAGNDGALWFTESGGSRIGRITTGGLVHEFATPTAASHPVGITIGPDNALWFVEQDADQVARLVPSANQRWLAHVYLDLLGRNPDVAGLAGWTKLLDAGVSKFQVTQWIEASPEYRARQTEALYERLLGRAADPMGLGSSMNYLSKGGTTLGLEAILLSSHEYILKHNATNNWIYAADVFQAVLGRPANAKDVVYFGKLLDHHTRRDALVRILMRTKEGLGDRVQGFYNLYLHRGAEMGGFLAWRNAFAAGMSESEMTAGFLASDEYIANS
jgi:virginiamycin B lyase